MSKEQIVNLGMLYVNGLNTSIGSNTTAVLSSGQCRDSTNVFDITLPSSVIINFRANGVNGLDTGTFDDSVCYNVFVISDSSGFNSPAGLASLSVTSPTLPSGYNIFRRVGFVTTDSSVHLIPYDQVGTGSSKRYIFDDPVQILSSGTQTTFTAIDTRPYIPSISGIFVQVRASFTPAAASNTASVRSGSSTGTTGQTLTGQVTSVVVNGAFDLVSKLHIDYKVSAGSLNLFLNEVVDEL